MLKTSMVGRLAAGVMALAAGATTIVAGSTAAFAADVNPKSASAVCGSGFSVVDSFNDDGWAYVYLLYNSRSGENCVVTMKQKNLGTKTRVSAWLETEDDVKSDPGNYEYYAGPVRLKAQGKCVRFGGEVKVNGQVTFYSSPWGHCG
jgi:hypothetical protein